jgi:hypothetical protein
MWVIHDEDAPKIADYTYQYLLCNGMKGLDPSDAATALNHVVLALQEDLHTIQSNIPKVVHDCKFDKLPMFLASGYSADCTELQRVSDELMGSRVLNYGHCPVSSLTPEH